ncbi:hypothetical protein CcCBS67573_g02158 [Chytriomyces confervae]|uniref:C2H2-type domain-containing protein n=1 Tax=Chytriomyces confervae TaxID=246404 RepID=A0A507FLH4_9FUNG|nr:hypothetical protein CcCBS67573_g02158 [Chytriomyces confervae]
MSLHQLVPGTARISIRSLLNDHDHGPDELETRAPVPKYQSPMTASNTTTTTTAISTSLPTFATFQFQSLAGSPSTSRLSLPSISNIHPPQAQQYSHEHPEHHQHAYNEHHPRGIAIHSAQQQQRSFHSRQSSTSLSTSMPSRPPTPQFRQSPPLLPQQDSRQSSPSTTTVSATGSSLLQSQINQLANSNKPAARFQCHLCVKAFRRKHHLESHLTTHSPEYPFPCQIGTCLSKFKRHADLMRHQRTVVHRGNSQ